MMRVSVDDRKCCGAAQCVLAAPAVFDQGGDGLVRLLDATPPAVEQRRVQEAADSCPSRTITIHEY
jgi:ferredoxin